MTDPVLRDLLIESVRRTLGLRAGESLPRMLKLAEAARVLEISHHKACDLARRNEFPGQVTRERPIRISTYGLIQALLGLDGDRVEAPGDGSPGLVVQQGSPSSNGRREGQLPARISVPGRESSSEEPS